MFIKIFCQWDDKNEGFFWFWTEQAEEFYSIQKLIEIE